MQCPVCDEVTLAISSRESIEIDHCPQCRGVWLDRGELDKIIERAAPSVLGTPQAPTAPAEPQMAPRQERYDDHYRYERERYGRYDKKRRRKNFLEELFDFD